MACVVHELSSKNLGHPIQGKVVNIEPENMKLILDTWQNQVKFLEAGVDKENYQLLREYKQVISFAKLDASQKNMVLCAFEIKARIQGIMIGKIQNQAFYIEELSTAPENLSIFTEKPKQKGVGRELIQHAIKLAVDLQLSALKVRFFDGAIGFYKKLGMIRSEQGFILNINHKPGQICYN